MSFLGTLLGGGAGFLLGGPAGAAIGASIGGGVDAANTASKAAGIQADATNQATQLQRDIFERQTQLQEPWRQAGINALARMQSGDVMSYMDPSYKFRLSEGMKALQRTAAARGGLLSGGAMKEAMRYGQGLASTEYGNAYNRLASMAGLGQTSTNAMANEAGTYGSNVGNLMTSGAAARASGYVGGTNALNQALSGAGNMYMQNQIYNRLFPSGGTGPSNADIERMYLGM